MRKRSEKSIAWNVLSVIWYVRLHIKYIHGSSRKHSKLVYQQMITIFNQVNNTMEHTYKFGFV